MLSWEPPWTCSPMADGNGLKIGIDASRTGVEQETGTERYSRRIIEAMLEAGPQHDYRLYLNRRQTLRLAVRANTIQRTIPFARLWTHLRLSAELAQHPVDALFVPAHVVPPIHPRATVVTIHDLGYIYEPGAHRSTARRYLDLSTRWSCRQSSHVIAISGATRDDLIREYNVPASKITVIHHGIDEKFRPADHQSMDRLRDRLGLPKRYILYLGTLQPRKNIVRLIQAFDILAGDDSMRGH
jgi:glycosyltransferase involved in cell wall biosynthesis